VMNSEIKNGFNGFIETHKTSRSMEDLGGQLEGDIITIDKPGARDNAGPLKYAEGELNTLDEPIFDTIKRDLKAVGKKVSNAMCPYWVPKFLLVEWDMWGALFFASYIGILLQQLNSYDVYASQFTQIVLVVFLGTAAVTYSHVVMLRTNTSIFQYISVLGYCLAPLALSVTVTYVFDFFSFGRSFWARFLFFIVFTAWSILASLLILKPDGETASIPYHMLPIIFYYMTIGLLILYHTHLPPSHAVDPVPAPSHGAETEQGVPPLPKS